MSSCAPSARLRWRVALVAAYVVVALVYSVAVPIWEAPDEPGHFDFAVHLRRTLELPDQRSSAVSTAHHPPLYYALAALVSLPANLDDASGALHLNPRFTWANGPHDQPNVHQHGSAETFPFAGVALALHLMRALSVALSAGVVWLTAALGDAMFPRRPQVGLLAAALVAFNPQFAFIGGAALNDNLLNLAAAGAILFIFRAMSGRDDGARANATWARRWAAAGVWVAVAALSKINGIAFGAVAAAALAYAATRRRSLRAAIVGGLSLGLPVVLLAGWWFVRNQIVYGDLLGDAAWQARFPEAVRDAPPELGGLLREQFLTFWARFGWMNIGLQEWFYVIIAVVAALGLGGLALLAVRQLRTGDSLSAPQIEGLVLCVGCVLLQEALLVRENARFTTAAQGRYLFPVIAPAMLLLSVGLNEWLSARAARFAVPGVAALGFCVALAMPFVVIRPEYRTPTLAKLQLRQAAHPLDVDFGGVMGLRGYDVRPADNPNALTVRLYWAALLLPKLDFSSFVHVVPWAGGPDGGAVGQEDQAPGTTLDYRPSAWTAGDIVLDERVVKLSASTDSPLGLRIGVYDSATGRRLPITRGEAARPDFVFVPIPQPMR